MLHQMTWPPQSPDINPIEMVWDELDRRAKEKQPTSTQHMWELFKTVGKAFQVKLVERMPRVCKAVIKAKGGYLKNLKYKIYLHLFFNSTITQHTSRLCKGYLTKKESDGLLHQMTWPPQLLDLNPIEMVWDKLEC